MDQEKRRIIASKGGKAAHEKGSAHEFTPEEAREAGRKGGHVAHQRGTAHQFTSEEAREAGRKGGLRSRPRASTSPPPPAEQTYEAIGIGQASSTLPWVSESLG
jgi:general stress protein YciG